MASQVFLPLRFLPSGGREFDTFTYTCTAAQKTCEAVGPPDFLHRNHNYFARSGGISVRLTSICRLGGISGGTDQAVGIPSIPGAFQPSGPTTPAICVQMNVRLLELGEPFARGHFSLLGFNEQ